MVASSAMETDDEKIPILGQNNENQGDPDDEMDQYGEGSVYFYSVVVFISLGGFLFGYDTGVVSGAMIPLKRVFDLSTVYQQVVVSVAIAGAIVGAWLSGIFNDVVGRRPVLLVASLLFGAGSIVLGAANGVAMLIIGRAVVGVGIGLASMTVPVYLAESAPSVRGNIVTVYQLNITAGQFIASLVNGAFSYLHTNGWRFMLGISAVPSVIMFGGCLFAPESPRWLIQNDKLEGARVVLHSIRNVENVDRELNDIKSATATEVRIPVLSSLKKMLTIQTTRRALLLGCGLQMFQQLSAINTVMYYSASIIQLADECPLGGTKLWSRLTSPIMAKKCIEGITERPFKDRFKEHKKSFNNRKLINVTEPSKEIWRIKDKGGTPTVKWKILKKAKLYNPKSKCCSYA